MIENIKKKYTGARVMTPAEMNRLHFDSDHSRLDRVESSGIDKRPKSKSVPTESKRS